MGSGLMKTLTLISLCCLWSCQIQGQLAPSAGTVSHEVQNGVESLKQIYPEAKIVQSPTTGLPISIRGLDKVAQSHQDMLGQSVDDALHKFLNHPVLKALFPNALTRSSLVEVERHANPASPGKTIVTVQQMVNGLPVFGGQARIQVSPSQQPNLLPTEGEKFIVSEFNSNLFTLTEDVTTQTTLPQEKALEIANSTYSSVLASSPQVKTVETSLFGPAQKASKPRLMMFDPSSLGEAAHGLRPTWIVNQGSFVFFFDANSGSLIHQYRNLHQLASFKVQDYSLGFNTPQLLIDETNDNGAQVISEARAAFRNAISTRQFFKGLNLDILPSKCDCDEFLVSPDFVNLNLRYAGTNNSYWVPALNSAFFSDGYANAPDVVGHELTHGITEFM